MFKKVSFLKLLGGGEGAQACFAPIGGAMRRVNSKKAKIYIDTVSE